MEFRANKRIKLSIDATNDIFHEGRMINDAENGDAKQKCVMKIVEVNQTPHLCTFADRDIAIGEELRYDYGVPTLPWRKDKQHPYTRKKAMRRKGYFQYQENKTSSQKAME
ncbi:hypothetical protein DPMN_176866 [Dreissena polymorpha]|uniref:SET domain-containing protein n=1 Tax=Dreissena polymorpha TaxID=45954 RepID=A0A9D4E7P8_DREPO|nr:hypothetical protein DPMN_176866 [Dreissena polymorpha]